MERKIIILDNVIIPYEDIKRIEINCDNELLVKLSDVTFRFSNKSAKDFLTQYLRIAGFTNNELKEMGKDNWLEFLK